MPYFKKTFLVFFLFAYLPIAPIFAKFIPLSLMGFSFWNTEFPFLSVLFYVFANGLIKKKTELVFIFTFLILIIIIILMRSIILYEDLFHDLFSSWFLFFPLFSIIALRYINFKDKVNIINIILFLQILFHGLSGWFYILGLPTIEFASIEKLVGGRFEGIYGASNGYSNYLFSFFLLLAMLNHGKNALILLCSIVVFGGIAVSGSRLPLLLLFLTLLFVVVKSFKINKLSAIVLFTFIYLVIIFSVNYLPFDIQESRLFTQGIVDTGRITKNNIAIEGLSSSFSSFIFGLSGSQFFKNGIGISDNSFTLIPISYGMIVFVFWLLLILFFSRFKLVYFRNSTLAFYLFCNLLIFSTNNSILWLPWVYFTIFGYYILKNVLSEHFVPKELELAKKCMNRPKGLFMM